MYTTDVAVNQVTFVERKNSNAQSSNQPQQNRQAQSGNNPFDNGLEEFSDLRFDWNGVNANN